MYRHYTTEPSIITPQQINYKLVRQIFSIEFHSYQGFTVYQLFILVYFLAIKILVLLLGPSVHTLTSPTNYQILFYAYSLIFKK